MRAASRFVLAALGLLLLLQAVALLRAPAAWQAASVRLRLAPGESVTLAPLLRARIVRDAQGGWLVAAEEGAPAPMLYRDDGRPDSLATMPLPAGDLPLPGAGRLPLLPAPPGQMAFTLGGSRWHYDGALLRRDGQPQADCPDARWPVRLASLWARLAPRMLVPARPLSFGGNLHCGNRVGLPGVLPGSAQVQAVRGALRVNDLERQPRPLQGVHALAVGATRAAIVWQDETMVLRPERRPPLFAQPALRLPPQVAWEWRGRRLWPAWPQDAAGAILPGLLAAALLALLAARAPVRRNGALACAALATLAAGLLSFAVQRLGQPPPAALSLLLAAMALGVWLPGTRQVGACAALLLAAGLLLQLELGLGGGDLRFYHKGASLIAAGLGGAAAWRLLAPRRRADLRSVEAGLCVLALAALGALAAQVLWGDETGVFDMQPVELAKLALCALSAHCLALRLGWHAAPAWRRWLLLAAPVLLFLALLAMALVSVDDYSPLVLLLLWSGAMALAYAVAAGRRLLAGALCLLALAGAGGVAALQYGGGAALPENFYAERFAVWLAPATHPHTGQQVLRAAAAIAQGGLAGADSSFGLRALGLPAGEAGTIPAVQDDFAPSFFLNRHGLLAALLLWGLQAAFLAALLREAVASGAAAAGARAFRAAWAHRFRCFALCGGAAFVGGHLLLSWGTNLAILPVMGQPMSFLSAGGSHLLFFLLPLLGLSAASNEE